MLKKIKFRSRGVVCFVSTVKDGNMSYQRAIDGDNVRQNRENFLKRSGISPKNCVFAKLDHGVNIFEVKSAKKAPIVDALITKVSGIALAVTAGDCVPIIYWDASKKILAISHNGWRGTLAGLTTKVLNLMKSRFGSNPQNIEIKIGPSICQKHYEVGRDVFDKIPEEIKRFTKKTTNNKWLLDLWGINKQQALDVGMSASNIEISGRCTYEDSNYFSSRRENGGGGRFIFGGMISG